ncbi:MAG: STAS domain-containing protein [Gammaproteobacteria bacterium]|nr:STAS domain-containing protein [Rhodocyclaceae bacterium]MBU3908227.1 STAS domain-containing protein [Gammaproteobacteria bacterium]MBU3990786.1 STAS domain-containing protein [Gammaproteobacteria bacterium]MBU4003136.1 STAS domain-containing protein [Gammaproteobacteria bacterium]MBU4019978.1 STAS domain-containing protein [Gammaproteobacteria bacterium]
MSTQIQRAEGHLAVSGNMTLETASGLLANGVAAIGEAAAGAESVFDLAAVADVDSSGLAVLFGWQRAASAQGKALRVANPPDSLVSLAEVYGATELLPLS